MNPLRLITLTIKQTIKKPAIIGLLLIIPLIAVVIKLIMPTASDELRITALYYLDADNDETENLYDALEDYDGLFVFEPADSKQQLINAVEKGQAECGYIIDSEIYEKMAKHKYRDSIQVVVNDNTTLMPVINETLYSIIFPTATKADVTEYLENDSLVSPYYKDIFSDDTIDELFDTYFTNGSTFHFEYNGEPDDYTFTNESILLSPLRGILALLILIAGFSGGLAFYKEAENPVFALKRVRLAFIVVPIILLSISAIISLIIGGIFTSILTELSALLLYDLLCTVICFIMSLVIKKGSLYAGILPVIILGCLVFTPIIIDLEGLIPILDNLSYIWPTKYYLMFFN